MYRLGGLAGFFRGVQARVMHQMPSTAICWSTYEFFKYLLGATDVRIVPTGSVLAEEEKATDAAAPTTSTKNESVTEMITLKPREIPAMSGAGVYGSMSYNTMHKPDSNFKRKDSVLDIMHT